MPERILVVEDEIVTRRLLTELLQVEGYSVTAVTGFREAIATLDRDNFDLILLDVVLSDGDGLTLCRRIRSRHLRTPVIMITSRGDSADVVAGLELGADDYIVKPFNVDVLAARVRAQIRRAGELSRPTDEEKIVLDDLAIDPSLRDAVVNNRAVGLTQKEFELLLLLARRRGRAVSKEEIANELFEGEARSDKILAVYVRRIREKIEHDANDPQHLMTIRGFGYMLGSQHH